MRYQVMQIVQFVASLSLMFAAFMGGIYVGWRRWGRRRVIDLTEMAAGPEAHEGTPAEAGAPAPPRRDLFAPELDLGWSRPEVDLRVAPAPAPLGLPAAADARDPSL